VLDSKKVFIFGYSGHAYVIIESFLAAGYTIAGYFDFQEADANPYQIPYCGSEREVDVKAIVKHNYVFPAIGDNRIREKLVVFFNQNALNQLTVIDPSAHVSRSAKLGKSTFVGKNAMVNALAEVGEGVVLNTASLVEHECKIESFVHVAPGAILCGNVWVGARCFLGAQSVVKQGLKISNDNVIGAGSVVLKDLMAPGIWGGNPIKKL
jgi:UDP-N-acetylbacillosamine N-acetyltransferase